jgi:hypothetical protein
MSRSIGVLSFVAAVVVLVAACSGSVSSSVANCGNVSPCGGNIVGTWKIASACSTGATAMPNSGCSGETVAVNSINDSGTISFNADGTYQASLDISASETVTLPMSCLTAGGVTLTCDQFAMALVTSVQSSNGGASPLAGTCTTVGSDCHCTVTVNLHAPTVTGTYTVSGTSFMSMPAGSTTPGEAAYCVQGNTLFLFGTGMMGGTPGSVVVADRQ